MHTLFVIQTLGPAGAERQTAHLAVGLVAMGQQVTVVCIGDAPDADRVRLGAAGVTVVELGANSRLARARRLPRLAALARRASVVVCANWDATFWGRVAAIAARRPTVVVEHAVYRELQLSSSGRPRARWIALHNRLLDPFTYATVACAEAQLPVLRSEGVASSRTVLIPNGVPTAALRAGARREPDPGFPGVGGDTIVLLHVARLTALKNQRQSMRSARRLVRRGHDVVLLLLGDGEDRAELQAMAADEPWVRILGARDDVAPYLGRADLMLLPSRAEAMPMAIAEAIAVGLPVVATDVGDVGAILRRTGAGVVVGADDPDGFDAAVEALVSDPVRRRDLAACAEKAAPEFDASTMVRSYADLLAAAVRGAPLSTS